MSNFVDLTREDLIEGIVNFIIPQIVSEKGTLTTYNMEKEDGEGFAIKKEDDKYFKAKITWEYWNECDEDFVKPDWVEISKEDIVKTIRKENNELTINQLRSAYKRNEWIKEKLTEKERLENKLSLIKSLV